MARTIGSSERLHFAKGRSSPKPVQIKTGSRRIFTEVLEGLKEGDQVVTAALGKP